MEHSLLSIKILRRLLVAGYEIPNRHSEVQDFWSLTFGHVDAFIGMLTRHAQLALDPELVRMIEKHLLQLSKLHLEMARSHPAAFVLLPNSIDLVRAYWGLVKQFSETFGSKQATVPANGNGSADGDKADDVLEKLSLKGLLLIRACVKMVFNPTQTFRVRHEQEKQEKKQAETLVRHELLTRAFVEDIMNVTVTRFFVIRESDLREWEEEPEEWEGKEENGTEGFEFSIRPCAERLFLDVAIHFKEILMQPLLGVFGSVASKSVHVHY